MAFDWAPVEAAIRSGAIQNLGSGQKATVKRAAKSPSSPIPGVEVSRSGLNTEELAADFDAVLVKSKAVFDGSTMVRKKMDKLILSPGEFVPKPGDEATFRNQKYRIVEVDTPKPDGSTAIVHSCTVEV